MNAERKARLEARLAKVRAEAAERATQALVARCAEYSAYAVFTATKKDSP
jgi:hypothetical protein